MQVIIIKIKILLAGKIIKDFFKEVINDYPFKVFIHQNLTRGRI